MSVRRRCWRVSRRRTGSSCDGLSDALPSGIDERVLGLEDLLGWRPGTDVRVV